MSSTRKTDHFRSADGLRAQTKGVQLLLEGFPPAAINALLGDRVEQQAQETVKAILTRAKPTGLQLRTLKAQIIFLRAFATCGNVAKSCGAADTARATVYGEWLKQAGFSKLFSDAKQDAADLLEAEAWRRGVTGVNKPIFYKGAPCGVIREYSDQLLMFLLRGCRPEIFRDRVELKLDEKSLEQLLEDSAPPPAGAAGSPDPHG